MWRRRFAPTTSKTKQRSIPQWRELTRTLRRLRLEEAACVFLPFSGRVTGESAAGVLRAGGASARGAPGGGCRGKGTFDRR